MAVPGQKTMRGSRLGPAASWREAVTSVPRTRSGPPLAAYTPRHLEIVCFHGWLCFSVPGREASLGAGRRRPGSGVRGWPRWPRHRIKGERKMGPAAGRAPGRILPTWLPGELLTSAGLCRALPGLSGAARIRPSV
jgi:hypothetical protein